MDFNDSPEEARFRARVRQWLSAHKPEPLQPGEDRIAWGKRWQNIKYSGGWGCPAWPAAWGGMDATPVQSMIFSEEEAGIIAPPDYGQSLNFGVIAPTLITYMSPDQKKRFLPGIAAGREIWCQLFSEPAAGSDLAGVVTRAVRDGDEWIINGQKTWTTQAQYADFGILLARSDPAIAKHRGLTFFFLDMKSAGIEVKPIRQINGEQSFNEVWLTDVRIPDHQRLGEVGEGWKVALHTLMNERVASGAKRANQALDTARLMRIATATALETGNALANDAVRDRIADYYVTETGLRYTMARARTAVAKGGAPGPENSIIKLVAGKNAQNMASDCMDLLGLCGAAMEETGMPDADLLPKAWLSAPGGRLAAGTDEILLNILAERVLGLPQEIRRDKDRPFQDIPRGPGMKER